MSERQWTQAQKDAVEARGALLLSAAAGSGKTTVLTERVIGLITDPEHPIDADRILIVTFTRAAAAEMKDRISRSLAQRLAAAPREERPALRRQQMLLEKAQISTVDSFCMDLVSENFEKLSLSPDFRVFDENRLRMMRLSAIDTVIDGLYENEGEDWRNLCEIFGTDRSDRKLVDMLLNLYDFVSAHPFPESWLRSIADSYRGEDFSKTVFGKEILSSARETLTEYRRMLSARIAEIAGFDKLKAAYGPAFSDDSDYLDALIETVSGEDWNGLYALLQNHRKAALGSARSEEEAASLRARLQLFRKTFYGMIDDLKETICAPLELCTEDLRRTAPFTDSLFRTLEAFIAEFSRLKRAENAVDFSDLEHFALQLLVEETPQGIRRREIADQIAARYDQIMIDEYQDTNETQELIFRAVSRNEENLFAVGDVKQSIYSFRQAMPQLFLRRREKAVPYRREAPQFPAYITLEHNFRSRREVTGAVNFFFNPLMRPETGGIDYQNGEQLIPKAEYAPSEDGIYTPELCLISGKRPGQNRHVTQAVYLAGRIRQMLDEKMTVTDPETKQLRPIRPGDIAVLLRNVKAPAVDYQKVFEACGIEAQTSASENFFERPEIAQLLAILRAVDNPMQDVPLAAAMLHPVFGFSPDELAAMRLQSPRTDLYAALLHAAAGGQKYEAFLKNLRRFRRFAGSLSVGDFLNAFFAETAYPELSGAMPQGELRLKNLRALISAARDYDTYSTGGLHGFLRYLTRLEEEGGDQTAFSAAGPVALNSDSVKIMSIHASKGLEFPVCILAGCADAFKIVRDDAVMDMDLGFGIRLRGENGMTKYSTALREAIKEKITKENLYEEMRVLYVAMTRAREKLILVCDLENPETKLSELSAKLFGKERFSACAVREARSFADWLLMGALRHEDGGELRALGGGENLSVLESEISLKIHVIPAEELGLEKAEEKIEAAAEKDAEFEEKLRRDFSFTYPYESLCAIPSKIAASEIAHSQNAIRRFARPAFLSAKGLTPAQRGTAIHDFMQFCDLARAKEDPEREIARLTREEYISKAQADSIDRSALSAFFSSEAAERMLSAPQCLREYRFAVLLPAGEAFPEAQGDAAREPVILQGAFDCVLLEDDGAVIIDYKSDRIDDAQELADRYREQLRLYREAVPRIFSLPVKTSLIYSFHLGKSITVY